MPKLDDTEKMAALAALTYFPEGAMKNPDPSHVVIQTAPMSVAMVQALATTLDALNKVPEVIEIDRAWVTDMDGKPLGYIELNVDFEEYVFVPQSEMKL